MIAKVGVIMKKISLKEKLKSKKFFFRIFNYLSIILFLTIIFISMTYVIAVKGLKEGTYNKINFNLKATSETIDTRMNEMQNIGIQFFNNDIITQYFRIEEKQDSFIKSEQWRILRVLLQNEFIFPFSEMSMFAYFPEGNKVYTSAGVYDIEFFFENICNYSNYTMDYWKNQSSESNPVEILRYSLLENTYIGSKEEVIPIVTKRSIRGNTGVLIVNMETKVIKQMLEASSTIQGTRFLILNNNNEMLIDTEKSSIGVDDVNQIFQNMKHGKKVVTIDHMKYTIFSHVSEGNGWNYIELVPSKELNLIMNINLILILVIGIILLILWVVIAYSLRFRIYKPINFVVEELMQKQPELISDQNVGNVNMDEMGILRTGVEVLLDQYNTYNERFKEYKMERVEHSLQLMIHGIPSADNAQISNILREQYGFTEDAFICCNILFDFTMKFYNEFTEVKRDKIVGDIRKILQILIGAQEKSYVLEMNKEMYSCILNVNNNEELNHVDEMFQKLLKIFETDKEYFTVSIGIGNTCTSISKISTSYNQAITALRNKSNTANYQIVYFGKLPARMKVVFSFYDQKKIVNCIKIGNEKKLINMISNILDINKKNEISNENMAELYRQLIAVGSRYLEDTGKKLEDFESISKLHSEIIHKQISLSFEAGRRLVLAFFQEILKVVKSDENLPGNKLIDMIEEMVRKNYSTDLSLDSIADMFGVSAKYISRVFKQKSGKNLTDYIGEVRVEEAKELLLNTNLKIDEIAEAVGIGSRGTFLRVFKKMEGVSPSEYRLIQKNHNA